MADTITASAMVKRRMSRRPSSRRNDAIRIRNGVLVFVSTLVPAVKSFSSVTTCTGMTAGVNGRITFQQWSDRQSTLFGSSSSSLSSSNDDNEYGYEGPPLQIADVDVLYGSRSSLRFDPALERFVPVHSNNRDVNSNDHTNSDGTIHAGIRVNGDSGNDTIHSQRQRRKRDRSIPSSILSTLSGTLGPQFRAAFIPEGVTDAYYRFVAWRVIQRYISSILHVIGTQSLLLGLGFKAKSMKAAPSAGALGLSAVMNWVLKDALGKLVRLLWASRMGRKFDSDAKRWRFRSSLLFALGNGLEIVTYLYPSLFLLWATTANCCKQISMLTSSSTRTAIYNSFRTTENIGDITAKGEAQIAIVDLFGIVSGIGLCRLVLGGLSRTVVAVYAVLQLLEIVSMYKTIRAVEFRVLNFERLVQVARMFVAGTEPIPNPTAMARTEKIFLAPQHLDRRAIAFGSLGRAKLTPTELKGLQTIFSKEKYLLVVGEDVKNHRRRRTLWPLTSSAPSSTTETSSKAEDSCHIVLHVNATDIDIVKSTLALTYLRQDLATNSTGVEAAAPEALRSGSCLPQIEAANKQANKQLPVLLKQLSEKGWASPGKFMFGRTTRRADWPLQSP